MFDKYQVPRGLPVQSDPDANGLVELEHGQRHVLQVRDPVPVHAGRDGLRSLQRGLPPRRRQFAARRRDRPRAGHLRAGHPQELRGRHQEPVVRQPAAVQRLPVPHGVGRHPAALRQHQRRRRRRVVARGQHQRRQGRAEGRGIRRLEWYATDGSASSASVFLASPEFTEDTWFRTRTRCTSPKGWTMPISPKEKYWASVEYTFPDFLPLQGDLWTRFSYSWQGKVWDSLAAIEDFETAVDAGRAGRGPGVPDTRVEVGHVPARVHERQRLGHGVHRPQRLRRQWLHLPEQHQLRRDLRRPALAVRPEPAAAPQLQPVVHEAVVTGSAERAPAVEARHDLGGARQPPGREPWRRLPDRPRRARGPPGARLEHGGHRLAGPRLGPRPARHRLRRRGRLHRRQRRVVRLHARLPAASAPGAIPTSSTATRSRSGSGPCSSPPPASTRSSASTWTARNSTGRCTSSRTSSASRAAASTRARMTAR